jgi:hypothetical protein
LAKTNVDISYTLLLYIILICGTPECCFCCCCAAAERLSVEILPLAAKATGEKMHVKTINNDTARDNVFESLVALDIHSLNEFSISRKYHHLKDRNASYLRNIQ